MSFERIIFKFQGDLSRAADEFFANGLLTFHKQGSQAQLQVALANISIAVELMLKAYLARISPALVLSDLSPEDLVAFQATKLFSDKRRCNTAIKLNSREFKSRELGDCLGMLFALKPGIKAEFGSYLLRFARSRNGGVHSAIASHSIHDVDRSAYTALRVLEHIGKDAKSQYVPTKADLAFLKKFDAERTERVRKAIEAAQRKFHSDEFCERCMSDLRLSRSNAWRHRT